MSRRPPARPERPTTLVLLSGMLGDERLWGDVIDRVGSDVPVLPLRTDVGDSVRRVAENVLDAAPERFALAGHSFGGIVAFEIQRLAPRRVLRLATLGASAVPGTAAQRAAWLQMVRRTEAGHFEEVAADFVTTVLPGCAADSPLTRLALDMALRVGPAGLLDQLRAQTNRPDSRPTLPGVDVPTLVVVGAADGVCPRARQTEIADAVPGAVTAVVDGAGHMSPLEAPDEVARVLRTWWAEPSDRTETIDETMRTEEPS